MNLFLGKKSVVKIVLTLINKGFQGFGLIEVMVEKTVRFTLAKGVGRLTGARVQISSAPPLS